MSTTHTDDQSPFVGTPLRFAATLVVALLATSPAFAKAIEGESSLPAALVRFLLASAALWIVFSVAAALLRTRDAATTEPDEPPVHGSAENDMPAPEMTEMMPGAAAADR
ncbi:MAG TPA: hypothetical protein VF183_05245 [Acidimicrobiales bacterium]